MLDSLPSSSWLTARCPQLWAAVTEPGLHIRLVQSKSELREVQRLRFDVFSHEMQASFPSAHEGLDQDELDPWCAHFMVIDEAHDQVVGTYRLLTPENAQAVGGYYTESEFDLSPLASYRTQMVEVGRSCIHPDYRNGLAIRLLWSAIANLMRQLNYRYLLGCASVSLLDQGQTAAQVWRHVRAQVGQNGVPELQPLHPYPLASLAQHTAAVRLPPLIKGYLNLGAHICGAPAWDPDFNTADFPILFDLERMTTRYQRLFGFI